MYYTPEMTLIVICHLRFYIFDYFLYFAEIFHQWLKNCLRPKNFSSPARSQYGLTPKFKPISFFSDFFITLNLNYFFYFNRLFGMKRCGRCQATILSSELVMRARDLVFHVHCFSCAVCSQPLTKGDHFGMRDGAVLCRLHFEMALSEPLPPHGLFPPPPGGGGGMHYTPPHFPSPEFHPHHPPMPPQIPVEPIVGKVPFFNGAPAAPRQKGRPRKRKPKDLEGMTANLGSYTIKIYLLRFENSWWICLKFYMEMQKIVLKREFKIFHKKN